MMRKFKLFRGYVSPNTRRILTINAQPRQRRIPIGQIPIPEYYQREYQGGWATAQLGCPLNENPHPIGSNQCSMWECGWNDFVNNH